MLTNTMVRKSKRLHLPGYKYTKILRVPMARGGKIPMVVSWNVSEDGFEDATCGFSINDKKDRTYLLTSENDLNQVVQDEGMIGELSPEQEDAQMKAEYAEWLADSRRDEF
jgi:hypothetical protein